MSGISHHIKFVIEPKKYRENPLRYIKDENHAIRIVEAHYRHTRTDYELKLDIIHGMEEEGIIERGHAREYARTMTMEQIYKLGK